VCPWKPFQPRKVPPWWYAETAEELRALKESSKIAFQKAQSEKTDAACSAYRVCNQAYKYAIRKAKGLHGMLFAKK